MLKFGFGLCFFSFLFGVNSKTTKLFAQNIGHLVDTRLDPLVNPGTCSSHVHSVYGNARFAAEVTPEMYADADWRNLEGKYEQTTSELIPNLSSYWVPSMYIYHDIKDKYFLVPSFARPYYRIVHRNGDRSNINPYPPFLRMIVGDASRQTFWAPEETERDNIKWTLTTFNRRTTNYLENGDWSYLVDNEDLSNDERGQVEALFKFPDCLEVDENGDPRTESPNFRSHAAYSGAWNDQTQSFCPTSHPYQIPRLDLEVRYELKGMRERYGETRVNDVRNWRLSTGDPTGAGAHADFISGWPQELLTDIIENCIDGEAKDESSSCILEEYDLNGRYEEKTVPFTSSIPKEKVTKLSSLRTGECPRRWTP